MSAKTNDFKIGLFGLAGLGLLIGGLLAFGGRDYFEDRMRFETCVFGSVEGLNIGSAVKYRGLLVGKVTGMEFAWNIYPGTKTKGVIVEFETQRDIVPGAVSVETCRLLMGAEIIRGLRVRTQGIGITGVSDLIFEQLDPADHPLPELDWVPRRCFVPWVPSQLGQMLSSIEETLQDLERVDLQELGSSATQVLGSIDALLNNVNQLDFKNLGDEIKPLLIELRDTNRRLSGLIDTAQTEITGADLGGVSRGASELMDNLNETNRQLQDVLGRLGELELAPVNEIIRNIRAASDRLQEVLGNLRDDPSGLIFGTPPPPARSLQQRRK